MDYDNTNIFAKILRGDIPKKTVYEDDYVLAFHDVAPQASVHVLVIPKGAYIDIADFSARASDAEKAGFFSAVDTIVNALGLKQDGFRTIFNTGHYGGQEVPHMHMHILGGEKLGAMLGRT